MQSSDSQVSVQKSRDLINSLTLSADVEVYTARGVDQQVECFCRILSSRLSYIGTKLPSWFSMTIMLMYVTVSFHS